MSRVTFAALHALPNPIKRSANGRPPGPGGVFQFVPTGQTIDRKLYDHLNSYTGELSSDGVVRVAAANLNATLIHLAQPAPAPDASAKDPVSLRLAAAIQRAPRTAFLVVPGKSDSGSDIGILRSVKADPATRGAARDRATLDAILACFKVRSARDHDALMHGCAPVVCRGDTLREARAGADAFGLHVEPRPATGFVHCLLAAIAASAATTCVPSCVPTRPRRSRSRCAGTCAKACSASRAVSIPAGASTTTSRAR